jgi:ribosomal protein L40E
VLLGSGSFGFFVGALIGSLFFVWLFAKIARALTHIERVRSLWLGYVVFVVLVVSLQQTLGNSNGVVALYMFLGFACTCYLLMQGASKKQGASDQESEESQSATSVCPACNKISPLTAQRCQCGYSFRRPSKATRDNVLSSPSVQPPRPAQAPVPGAASARVTCKSCAHSNDPDAKFCDRCGTRLDPPSCPRCNALNSTDATFCKMCGSRIRSAETHPST